MSSKNTGTAPGPDLSGQSFMHPPFLDFALKSPASVPGIWKETVSALADATDDYAALLRQLGRNHPHIRLVRSFNAQCLALFLRKSRAFVKSRISQ